MNEPKFNVTDIEFDFTDSQGELDEWEQDQIVKNNIGVWEADCEEDLLRVIGVLKAQAKQPKAEW